MRKPNFLGSILLPLTFTTALIAGSAAFAASPKSNKPSTPTNNGGGNPSNNGSTSGNTFDCSKNPTLCTGNSGSGVGNGGPGNQGNDKPVGNTGGGNGSTPGNGGSNPGGGNSNPGGGNSNPGSGGSNPGNGNSNPGGGSSNPGNGNAGEFDCSRNPNLCTGNNGNGNGNTGPGNQGNDKPNGNAGGGSNGGGNNGGGNNGGGNNGGGNNGGGNNGGGNNGGGNNGGGNNGGGNNGGGNNGGGNNGGGNNGGGNNGGGNNGGGNNGGGNNGGGNNGGGNNGGGNNGGGNNGGGNNGGGNNGGGNNGGGNNGGGNNGGGDNGGSDNGGGNNGGGDNGGGDNGGSDNGGDQGTVTDPKQKRELKAQAKPALYLDFDSFKQVINLTPHDSTKEQPNLVNRSEYNKNLNTLVYKDHRSGFQVIDYSRLEFGLGGKLSFWLEGATSSVQKALWAQVGLIPMRGTEVLSIRYAPTVGAVRALPKMSAAPMQARDVQTWSNGDAVSFTSKGGMYFYTGAGVSLAGLTTTALAQGLFNTYVEKVNDQQVYVKITDSKVDTLSLQSHAGLVSVGTSNFKQLANATSFVMTITDDLGAKAYEDLVRGNIAAVQKLAANPSIKSVMSWEKIGSNQTGKFRNIFFGLPIIANITYSKGKIHDFSKTQQLNEKTVADAHYGIYMKEYRTRFFDAHTEETEAFYGSSYQLKDDKGKLLTKGFFGQMVLTANDDHSDNSSLKTAIAQVIRKTGMRNYFRVNVPSINNLEFTNVSLRVHFDETQTKNLIRSAITSSKEQMARVAMKDFTNYRALGYDVDDVCSGIQTNPNEDLAQKMESCQRTLDYQIKQGSEKMFRALASMDYHLKNGYEKEFAEAYARFGEAMMTNQFTFKLGLYMAGTGVQLDYAVEGTDLSSYVLTMESTNEMGVLSQNKNRAPVTKAVGRGKPTLDRGVILAPGKPGVLTPTQP